MTYILSFHGGHNASAAIGNRDGLQFAIQEERLNGEKNYWGLPRLSIKACMEHVGAKASDLTSVVHGGQQVLARYHSRDDVIASYRRQETLAGKLRQRVAVPLLVALNKSIGHGDVKKMIEELGLSSAPLVFHDHHFMHAATAYYGLRRDSKEKALVLTADGAGDGMCASVRVFGDGESQLVSETPWEHSLGALYSWITHMMGFVPLEHEYKLMGMAPYASDKAAEEMAKIFRQYLWLDETGLSFKNTGKRTSDLVDRLHHDIKGKRFDYICAGLQRFTEDILMAWTKAAIKKTGVKRVYAAGGVFMNVKANKRIAEIPEVELFEAFPSCGDETLPLGAFWFEASRRWGNDETPPLANFYLGDAPKTDDAERAVKASGFRYERPENMAVEVAKILASGQPLARCAGEMEFGARALGNRSILADPKNQDVVRVINQMVKKRDFWMPFAPMVLDDRADEYLVNPKGLPSPYMMMTFDTRENFTDLIAAVHNADLTCRAQILTKKKNAEMYAIMKAFEQQTGRGVILNTSFNLHGFPIVRTPDEALHVFRQSGLKHMQVGAFLVHKATAE